MLDKSKIILNWYCLKEGMYFNNKKQSSLKLYKDFVYKNLKKLKKMDCYKTRYDMELIIKKNSIPYPYDEGLYTIYLNNIFGVTLGMIDAKVDYYNRKIDSCIKHNELTKNLLTRKEEILSYKQTIIKDVEYFISDDNQEMKKLLKTMHSSATKEDLLEYIRTNKNEFNVAGELLNAYIYGYNKPLLNNYEELFLYYKDIMSEFRKIKDRNEYSVQKVKSLIKRKKSIN